MALRSAMGLAARGHRVTLLAAVGPVMPELERSGVRVLCTDQQPIASDPSRFRAAVQGLWNRAAAARLQALLRHLSSRHTILHLHGWTKALSSSVVGTAVRSGFPVVGTAHDYFMACPNGGFFHYPRQTVCTLKPLSPACVMTQCDRRGYPQKLWRVVRQVVQRNSGSIPRGIRRIVVVSEFSRDLLLPNFPPGARVALLPNFVDVERGAAVSVERNRAFMMVGRLSPEKGGEVLARAASRIGCATVFVGEGERREAVQALCPQATITGWLGGDDVRRVLHTARALVFPSLLYETQGLAVVEAASLGIPAVVSDVCAAREAVVDGVTGLWFRGGDVEDLVRKMSRMQDDDVVQAMGRAAYERYWSAPATVDEHISRLESIYAEVLSECS